MNSENWQALKTYLTKKQSSGVRTIRLPDLIAATGMSEGRALAAVSTLCDEGFLQAKLQVRCPKCDTHEGTYITKSELPNETITCFVCGYDYSIDAESGLEVVYDIQGSVNEDFFRDLKVRLMTFVDSASNLPPSYFQQEFERLYRMEGLTDESERGRMFDYFIGLLFIQIEGVTVTVKESVPRGEVDVFVDCINAPEWLHRVVGNVVLVENKWEATPIGQSDIRNFHDKAEDICQRTMSNLGYFISMSGYTTQAKRELEERNAPNIVPFDRDDTKEMVEEGSAESKIRENVV